MAQKPSTRGRSRPANLSDISSSDMLRHPGLSAEGDCVYVGGRYHSTASWSDADEDEDTIAPSTTEEEAGRRRAMRRAKRGPPYDDDHEEEEDDDDASRPSNIVVTHTPFTPITSTPATRPTYAKMRPSELGWETWKGEDGYDADIDEPARLWYRRYRDCNPYRSAIMRGRRHGKIRPHESRDLPLAWFWWPGDREGDDGTESEWESEHEAEAPCSTNGSDAESSKSVPAKRKETYAEWLGMVLKRRRFSF
ncbi:hypothetical protein ACHAQA_000495 [Verticillium albo-atrum]